MRIDQMDIIINEYGTSVGKKGNRIVVRKKSQMYEWSADHVDQIVFSVAGGITTDAIKLAIEKNIDIVLIDWRGEPYARIYPCRLGGTTLTRKRQLEAVTNGKGLALAKAFVEGKVKNQLNFLKALAKDHPTEALRTAARKYIKPKSTTSLSGSLEEIRPQLLGIEGYAASQYFSGIGSVIPLSGRDPKAQDLANIVLNYSYGILYGEVERSLMLAGLDPYLGYYHTDRYGKPCLTLDLIEEFRVPIADRAVVTLFNRREIGEGDLDRRGTPTLTTEGRKKVIEAVVKRLKTEIEYRSKRQTFQAIILEQAREISRFVLGHSRQYKPFIYWW